MALLPEMLWPYTPSVKAQPFSNDLPFPTLNLHILTANLFQLHGLLLEETGDSNCSIKLKNFGVGGLHYRDGWDDAKMCDGYSEVTVCVYVCLTGNILFCTCSYSYNPTTMKN
jgi:hypothetical protein